MAKAKKTTTKSRSSKKNPGIQTKGWIDVASTIDRLISRNLHDRHNLSLSDKSQHRIVAYGPWLAVSIWIFAIPQLIALAKTGGFLSLNMLLETMVYSRESWVILLLFFITSVAVASSITDLSLQKLRGWNRVYTVTLLNLGYVIYQIAFSGHQPAGALLSGAALVAIIFVLLDVRKYYSS